MSIISSSKLIALLNTLVLLNLQQFYYNLQQISFPLIKHLTSHSNDLTYYSTMVELYIELEDTTTIIKNGEKGGIKDILQGAYYGKILSVW